MRQASAPPPQGSQPDIEPPNTLIFDSIDEYDSFVASIELTDEDFESFISNNGYSMNGISSKNDVIQVSNQINSILWPVSDTFDLSQMIFYPDREEYFILFSNEDAQSCSFLYYLDASKTADNNPLTSGEANYLLPVEMDADEKIADIFYFESEDSEQHSFYARIGGNTALIRIYGTADIFESVDILNGFSFDIE